MRRAPFRDGGSAWTAAASIVIGCVVSGCMSQNVQPASLVAQQLDVTQRHAKSVVLHCQGWTMKGGVYEITDETFTAAVQQSLQKAGIFASVSTSGTADLLLDVRLDGYCGSNGDHSHAITTWRLQDSKTQRILYQESFVRDHTTQSGEALSGPGIVRLAVEGATRKSIEEGIRRLSSLHLE